VETCLLATKLNVPPTQLGLVPRQRLIERLQAGLSCNLVLVSVPEKHFGSADLECQALS